LVIEPRRFSLREKGKAKTMKLGRIIFADELHQGRKYYNQKEKYMQ